MAPRLVLVSTLALSLISSVYSAGCTNGAVSGTRCSVQCGVDYPGGDYRQVRTNTFAACITACEQDTACVDAQYHNDNGFCYLKNKLTSSLSDSNVDSVICRPPTTTTTRSTSTTTTSTSPAPSCTPNGSGVKAAGSTCTYTIKCGILIMDTGPNGGVSSVVRNLQECVNKAAAAKVASFYYVENGRTCYVLQSQGTQLALANGYDSGFLENPGCGPK